MNFAYALQTQVSGSRAASRGSALVLGVTLALAGAVPASAQVIPPAPDVPSARAVEDLYLAWQLAAQGRRARSPWSLVAAADILSSVPTRPLDTGTSVPESGQPRADTSIAPALAQIRLLLADARALARGDRTVLAAVEQVKRRADRLPRGPFRGARGAPRERRDAVAGGQREAYVVTFVGREPALVRVVGDGRSDLNLYIYDEHDNLIVSDSNPSDHGFALWTPTRTGRFRIKVRNVGSTRNAYWLVTN